MIHIKIPVQVKGSLEDTHMTTYILEDWEREKNGIDRPLILLCPGGAYCTISPREAEPVALALNHMGFHVVILNYSCAPAVYPTALTEAAFSVKYIRDHAAEWKVDKNKIFVMGFSAGGHLAASYGVFWNRDFLAASVGAETEYLRPNGLILCYPVITSDERYSNMISMKSLLGSEYEEKRAGMSLEYQVGSQVPEVFIWHTFADESVPVENALRFVMSLRKAGIPTEFHMYPVGAHGLSLAGERLRRADGSGVQKECSSWISLLQVWLNRMAGWPE